MRILDAISIVGFFSLKRKFKRDREFRYFSIEDYENIKLLPLLESVKNLERIVPNIKGNALDTIQKCLHPSEGLSKDESASIQLYTMQWQLNYQSLAVKLNHALRIDNREQLVPYLPYLKLILTALSKLPSVQTTAWRGSRTDMREQYPVGKVFVWRAFR